MENLVDLLQQFIKNRDFHKTNLLRLEAIEPKIDNAQIEKCKGYIAGIQGCINYLSQLI